MGNVEQILRISYLSAQGQQRAVHETVFILFCFCFYLICSQQCTYQCSQPALPRCEVLLSAVASRVRTLIKNIGVLGGEQKVALPWGHWWTRSSTLSWQCAVAAQKTTHGLGCMQSPVGSWSRERALLHSGESHPECSIQPWGPRHQKDVDLLE